MRAGPRAASASASSSAPPLGSPAGRRGYPPARRLRRPAEFTAVMAPAAAAAAPRWRASRKWLAAQAAIAAQPPGADPAGADADTGTLPSLMQVRFGITVGKRNARRSVQRATVKRVLREAARHHASALDAAAGTRRIDVVLRLKSALPDRATLGAAELRRQLRHEADSLLAQLAGHLRQTAAGAPA